MRSVRFFPFFVAALTAVGVTIAMGPFSQGANAATVAPPKADQNGRTVAEASSGSEGVFKLHLSRGDAARFDMLTVQQRREAVALFNDPSVASMSKAQLARKYPGATVSSAMGSSRVALPGELNGPISASALAASATTYYVHSYFSHTASFLWIHNTATLYYYYWTGSNRVLRDNYCTWHDSGFTAQQISNISVNHWVSGGLGYCYADVQINDIGVFNGTVTHQMIVNGGGVYRTYFHDS